jgi:FkbM family methyltransferase
MKKPSQHRTTPKMIVSSDVCESGELFRAKVGGESIWFSERYRAARYDRGVKKRCEATARFYGADRIKDWRGKTVLDVGANCGEFSLYAHARGAQVIAIEPEPLTFEALRRNMEGTDVVCLNVALWKEGGVVPFYYKQWASSTLLSHDKTDRVTLAMTVRELLTGREISNVFFVKADVEGTEPELLQGAVGVFDRIRCLAVACGPERLEDECTDEACTKLLIEAGYKVTMTDTRRRVVWAE